MLVMRRVVVVFALFVILPATVFAQATLSGFVKDTSGGVLPGVNVEASSPVLIEKYEPGSATRPDSIEFRICLRESTRSPLRCPASPQ